MFYSVAYYLKPSDQSEFTIIFVHIGRLLRFYSEIRLALVVIFLFMLFDFSISYTYHNKHFGMKIISYLQGY